MLSRSIPSGFCAPYVVLWRRISRRLLRRYGHFARFEAAAEAVAGSKRARRGLCRVLERSLDSWDEKSTRSDLTAAEWYRCWLFGEGLSVPDEAGRTKQRGVSLEEVRKVREAGGKLTRAQLLRCRVRYFSDGVAIGSRNFIEELFQVRREHFGATRRDGARPIREAETGLFSMRALQVQAIE